MVIDPWAAASFAGAAEHLTGPWAIHTWCATDIVVVSDRHAINWLHVSPPPGERSPETLAQFPLRSCQRSVGIGLLAV